MFTLYLFMQIWENLQFLGIAMHRRRMMKVSNYLMLKHLETSEPRLLSYSPLDRPQLTIKCGHRKH